MWHAHVGFRFCLFFSLSLLLYFSNALYLHFVYIYETSSCERECWWMTSCSTCFCLSVPIKSWYLKPMRCQGQIRLFLYLALRCQGQICLFLCLVLRCQGQITLFVYLVLRCQGQIRLFVYLVLRSQGQISLFLYLVKHTP